MASEKLIETKLRLSDAEREAVNRLRGDRGQNVCLRRAVQQWILREEMLQEAIRLGHPIPGVHADGPIPVQPITPPRQTQGDASFAQIVRSNFTEPAESEVPPPVSVEEPSDEDEAGEEPSRRRPPTSAETWGAGPDRAS